MELSSINRRARIFKFRNHTKFGIESNTYIGSFADSADMDKIGVAAWQVVDFMLLY